MLKDLARAFAQSARTGGGSPCGFWIDADAKAPDSYAVYLYQAGLGLPDRDYYLKRDPFGRPSMRRFDNGAFSGGYPLDAAIFNDCGDRVLSAVCEYNSATFLVKSFDYDVFGSAPSEARRFLRGGSPRRVRISHPLVPSVGTMEEESNPNEVV